MRPAKPCLDGDTPPDHRRKFCVKCRRARDRERTRTASRRYYRARWERDARKALFVAALTRPDHPFEAWTE